MEQLSKIRQLFKNKNLLQPLGIVTEDMIIYNVYHSIHIDADFVKLYDDSQYSKEQLDAYLIEFIRYYIPETKDTDFVIEKTF